MNRALHAPGVGGLLAGSALALAAYALWLLSGDATSPAPSLALRQLDLLYLDEPAPLRDELDLPVGEPVVLVVCEACTPPEGLPARVVASDDPRVARAYALVGRDGSTGPGYALIDRDGRVRYRTFDPGLGSHAAEIRVLLGAL